MISIFYCDTKVIYDLKKLILSLQMHDFSFQIPFFDKINNLYGEDQYFEFQHNLTYICLDQTADPLPQHFIYLQ